MSESSCGAGSAVSLPHELPSIGEDPIAETREVAFLCWILSTRAKISRYFGYGDSFFRSYLAGETVPPDRLGSEKSGRWGLAVV